MKNYFFLILTLITISSCKDKRNENSETKVLKTEPVIETNVIEEQVELTEKVKTESLKSENKKITDWTHPEFFEFKNYKEYRVTDTISLDLNGNGILERIYFDKKDCPKLIIEEKGKDLI